MGERHRRPLTPEQIEKRKIKQDLLDAQDLAAAQFELNRQTKSDLLDTQELLAKIIEGGAKA